MLLAAARFVTMTANEATSETEMTRLWVGGALTSYGNEYGLVAAVAARVAGAIGAGLPGGRPARGEATDLTGCGIGPTGCNEARGGRVRRTCCR